MPRSPSFPPPFKVPSSGGVAFQWALNVIDSSGSKRIRVETLFHDKQAARLATAIASVRKALHRFTCDAVALACLCGHQEFPQSVERLAAAP